ncbi:MAG: flagellar hook-basal body complex protein [Planctomycetota bacterium]
MVSTALYTGLSGLRVHQTYIDVIGNNLANVSTPGFRGSRATFSDILSFTVRSGSGPNGNFGGQNPIQIGTGAFMASVDTDLNQGTLQDTGRSLDVALQGRGFFTLSNGLQNFYSRVGSFTIDANRALVDGRTGLRVVNSTGNFVTVPTSDTLPAQPTTRIDFQGNLPAEVGGPLAEILESNAPLSEGTAANKTGAAPSAGTFDVSGLAGAEIKVSVNGGAQQTLTVPDQPPYNAGPVTATDIATWLNGGVAGFSGISGATATVSGTSVSIDTVRLGSSATLKFDNVSPSQNVLAALGLDTLLDSGTETTADANSDLNALTARNSPYSAGDAITVSGTNPDGTAFSDTFIYGTGAGQDGVTLGALINFVNQTIDSAQATASLTAGGNIRLSAINKEEADLSLFIGDNSSTGGTLSWPNFEVAQEGTGPDTATTSAIVIDSRGRSHSVSMTFTRSTTDATVWDMQAELTDATGNDAITQSSIGQIRFNDNGSFNVIGGGTNSMSFAWDGISAGQSVTIDLGTSGQFDGISMLGDSTTVAAVDQDGYDAGTLLDVGFSQNGELIGIYSNGQSQTLDTLRVTMFSNEGGLVRQGDTLYAESPNSGDAIATTANAAGAGSVRAGQLENSNVDIAREFVNLIEAQRGFQANSRVITTTDEILAELMNIVR